MTNAREYLKTFREEEAKIGLKVRQLQTLRDQLTSISASMDKEPVSHTKNVSVMSETIARIVDLEQEIRQMDERLTESKCEAYHYFDQLQPEGASLLMDRYIDGKKNSVICEERFITDRHLRRLMSEAINALQEVLNNSKRESA